MTTKKKAAFVATVLCFSFVLTAPVQAQQSKRARAAKLFDKGVTAMERLSYAVALESFEAAYELSPHWRVLAHIGTCHAKLNKPVRAINALERYLEEGASEITADERDAARRMLGEQRKKVGALHLIVGPNAKTVVEAKIDGDSIGRSPFDTILVLSGPHHLIATSGDRVEEHDIEIAAAQDLTLKIFDDKPNAASVAAPLPPVAPPVAAGEESSAATEETVLPESGLEEVEPLPEPGHPINGASTPFFFTIGLAGAGLIGTGIGWGVYGYFSDMEKKYADALAIPAFDGLSWGDACVDLGKTSAELKEQYTTESELQKAIDRYEYFCQKEWKRRDYDKKTKQALALSIAGTAVTNLAIGTAILFYFHPEWFGGGETKESATALHVMPVIGPTSAGLTLQRTF